MARGRAGVVGCVLICLAGLALQSRIGAASFNGFTVAPTYTVGSDPRAEVLADFNGDGRLDLAVVGSTGNSLSVLLGNGDGTFQPATKTQLPISSPVSIVAGHFKSTTSLDLAIASSGSDNVIILTGNGNGTFNVPTCRTSPSLCPSVGIAPVALTTLTLVTNSPYQDLAVANAGSASVSLLQNKRDGTGNFIAAKCSSTTGTTCTVGNNPVSIVAGDFNGDGKVDLAVANAGSNTVSVLLNTGNLGKGAFQAALSYSVGSAVDPVFIAAGDLDGDTETDLVVASLRGGTGNLGGLAVLLNGGNDGSGHPIFSTTNYTAGQYPEAVAIGDLNGDGVPDLAVACAGGNQALVLLNSGTGSFGSPNAYTVGALPVYVAIADLNGDGKPDLATVNAKDNNVSILMNAGAGVFSAAVPYPAGTTPVALVNQDFDGDGKADLAVANQASNNVSVALGNGNGGFALPVNFSSGSGSTSPVALAAASLTGNHKIDLVVANAGTNTLGVLLNNSGGAGKVSFKPALDIAVGTSPSSVTVADFNGDGKMDLAVANRGSNTVSILISNGNGMFQTPVSYSVGSGPAFVLAADFNGDGKVDLAVANAGANTIGVLLGNGDGTFQSMLTTTVGETPVALASGDFNHDGKMDLVVANYNDNEVELLLGNGNGTFQTPADFPTDFSPSSVSAADMNADGNLDVVVANSIGNDVSVLLGDGTGSFSSIIGCPVGPGPFGVTVGLFMGTGKPLDVAVADQGANGVTVLLQPPTLLAFPTCNQ